MSVVGFVIDDQPFFKVSVVVAKSGNPLGSIPKTVYLDNDLAVRQGGLGVVDICWETPQDTVPKGGQHHTLTLQKQ